MTESVAYMSEEGVLFKELPPNPMFNLKPLYTLRELTDEEINEVFKSIYGHNNSYINSSLFKFARAILKKAREK
jgi:hypothetical protein